MASTFPVVPPPIAQAGAAAANASLDEATQQAKVATAKEQAAEAPLGLQERQATLAERQADLQQARLKMSLDSLGHIVPMLAQNPVLAKSPQILKTLSGTFNQMGIPLPTAPDGSLDVQSLQAFTSQPMGQAGVQHTLDNVDKIVQNFEKPNTDWTPEQFGAAIKQQYDLLMHTGNIPEAESLLSYITPDGKVTPAYAQRVASQYVETEMNHLNNLGIVVQNQEKFREDLLTEKTREFGLTHDEKVREDRIHDAQTDRRIANQAAATSQRLADAQHRLDNADQNLQLARDRFTQTNSMDALRAYRAVITSTRGQLQQWRTQFNSDLANVRQMTSSQLKSKDGQALVSQMSELKDLLDKNDQKYNAEASAADQGIGNVVQATTGNSTTVKPQQRAGGAVTRTGTLSGRQVEQRADGHVYYSGTDTRVPGQP